MDDSKSSSKIHTVHIKELMAAWMAAIIFMKLRNLVLTEKRMDATVPRIKQKTFKIKIFFRNKYFLDHRNFL